MIVAEPESALVINVERVLREDPVEETEVGHPDEPVAKLLETGLRAKVSYLPVKNGEIGRLRHLWDYLLKTDKGHRGQRGQRGHINII